MKKIILYGATLTLAVSLMGCTVKESPKNLSGEVDNKIEVQIDKEKAEKEEITNLVEGFGSKLKMVSLLAPKDVLEKEMKENYSEYISQGLMDKWLSDPENAFGRVTSSPWPEKIEIEEIEKISEDEYKVQGNIIEITSVETDGEILRPIILNIKLIEDNWLIDDITLK